MSDPYKTATPKEMRDLVASTPTDDPSWFAYGERILTPTELINVLTPHLSEDRRNAIDDVLSKRTDTLTVVVEGMVDVGNVSAVMRTVDGFGLQSMHSIDTAGTYKRSKRTTQGADKWLDRFRWESTCECYASLRERGFRILATAVTPHALPVYDIDLSVPTAFVLGNELDGLTDTAIAQADEVVSVPMRGFTESFNISVAAAIVLHEAVRQRREAGGGLNDLDPERAERIKAVWYAKSVLRSRAIVDETLRRQR